MFIYQHATGQKHSHSSAFTMESLSIRRDYYYVNAKKYEQLINIGVKVY